MAGRRQSHLERRSGVYYVRLPVPRDLQVVIGRAEVRRSLGTRHSQHASRLAYKAALAFQDLCGSIRLMPIATEEAIRERLDAFFASLVATAPFAPAFSGKSQQDDREYLFDMADELITGLRSLIAQNAYEDSDSDPSGMAANRVRRAVTPIAEDLVGRGFKLTDDQMRFLSQGVARALVEEQRLFQQRLQDPLQTWTPEDPYFAAVGRAPKPVEPSDSSETTVDQAVSAYIGAKAGVNWTARTELEQRRVLRWVSEHFGAETVISALTKGEVRSFRNALVALRFKPEPNAPFAEIGAAEGERRISAKTAKKYFEYFSSACRWWVDDGLLAASPVGNITVAVPKGKKSGERDVFSAADLSKLFTSPMYTGCKGPLRRMRRGSHLIKDDYYFVPLVGALSGMRLGEIIQLGLDDVVWDQPVSVMRVRASQETGGTVKSDAGWRDVPIHRRLLEIGFPEFVIERQKAKAHARIFSSIPFGSDGSASGEYSRWFGRRMTELGLKRQGLVFHSFRGTFSGALINADAPLHIVKAIVGHELNDDITVGYSGHEGVSLAQKKKWVDRFDLLDAISL